MGIMDKGAFGGFRKKVGNISGSFWRGLNVIKTLPRKSNKPPTQTQVDQRNKFSLVTSFLSYLSEIIDTCYKNGSMNNSPMNELVAYHIKEAVTGVSPNFTIDYTKLKFSNGKLTNPSRLTVDTTAVGKIDFNWTADGADSKYKDATDVINIMGYNAAKNQFITVMSAAPRSALTFILQCPLDWTGDEVYCYFSFSSLKKKNLHSKSKFVFVIPVA